MLVRKPQRDEFESTIIIVNYYCQEAAEAIPRLEDEFDENSILQTVRLYTSNVNYMWANAYDNGRPVGFIGGFLSDRPWNANLIDANVSFIYLLDSHKNMDNFRMLLKHFEEWATMAGAHAITAGDIGINPERFKSLFEHFGFKQKLLMEREIE